MGGRRTRGSASGGSRFAGGRSAHGSSTTRRCATAPFRAARPRARAPRARPPSARAPRAARRAATHFRARAACCNHAARAPAAPCGNAASRAHRGGDCRRSVSRDRAAPSDRAASGWPLPWTHRRRKSRQGALRRHDDGRRAAARTCRRTSPQRTDGKRCALAASIRRSASFRARRRGAIAHRRSGGQPERDCFGRRSRTFAACGLSALGSAQRGLGPLCSAPVGRALLGRASLGRASLGRGRAKLGSRRSTPRGPACRARGGGATPLLGSCRLRGKRPGVRAC